MPKITLKKPPELVGLPDRLRLAMKESDGMTQQKLEQLSGVGQSAISRLASASRPGGGMVLHLVLIAKALNVRVGWLAVGEEPMRAAAAGRPIFVDADAQSAPDVSVRTKNHKR